MVELFYWEDDPDAERLIEKLEDLEMEYKAQRLEAEIPNATPHVNYKGKTYWDLNEFLDLVESGANTST